MGGLGTDSGRLWSGSDEGALRELQWRVVAYGVAAMRGRLGSDSIDEFCRKHC